MPLATTYIVRASLTPEKLRRTADRYVQESFAKESSPQVTELAAQVGMNRSDFTKVFTYVVGEAPSAYLRRGQISCAKHLLTTTRMPMNAIAYRCGFGTRTTFFRAFKRETGMTPKQYRQNC